MKKETLLIELCTEELPPALLEQLGNNFATLVLQGLVKQRLVVGTDYYRVFSTPRRLGVLVPEVHSEQSEQEIIKKGPSVARGMVNGIPSKALQGFLSAHKATLEDLSILPDGKQEIYCYRYVATGESIAQILPTILEIAVKKIPVHKLMHWGDKLHYFIRPVHNLLVLFGDEVLPVRLFGLESNNRIVGHRFMSGDSDIALKHANDYEKVLANHYVIADFATRKESIKQQINNQCFAMKAQWVADEALLDEITGLVEWPVALMGTFNADFLELPQECLILTMHKHQKYFPLKDSQNKLLNSFLLISNIESKQPEEVIVGNERVVEARLSDATFFYEIDKKISLEHRLEQLKGIIYQHQLGSQYDRVKRLEHIAGHIAEQLQIDVYQTQRVAQLAKADLTTEMVGEFPELQGVMGKYYALHDKETRAIAEAIEQHYWPKVANGELPCTPMATSVSLADKLETLIGIWGIGLIPTGDKDPYALRRCALGIIRMLLVYPLDIKELLNFTYASFPKNLLTENTAEGVYDFILTRLSMYLQHDYSYAVVMATLSKKPLRFYQLPDILQAIVYFQALPAASDVIKINKRVANILKKVSFDIVPIEVNTLKQTQEIDLWHTIQLISQHVKESLHHKNYQQALNVLSGIISTVEAFFDHVMILSEDNQDRNNRLNLLNLLLQQLNAVADIAYLY